MHSFNACFMRISVGKVVWPYYMYRDKNDLAIPLLFFLTTMNLSLGEHAAHKKAFAKSFGAFVSQIFA
jgi:hypothetical protein